MTNIYDNQRNVAGIHSNMQSVQMLACRKNMCIAMLCVWWCGGVCGVGGVVAGVGRGQQARATPGVTDLKFGLTTLPHFTN